MAVLCPRCGEYSSILDEHCKKCGFSIKNYLDNRKRFGNVEVQATENGSSSVCVKEENKISDSKNKYNNIGNDKSDEIQENIMRLLKNVKIIPDENKVEENEKIESNVQSVLESALKESIYNSNVEETVKIVAKKVANDVIILPPDRVKVEIEASKDVVRNTESKGKVQDQVMDVEKNSTDVQLDKNIEKNKDTDNNLDKDIENKIEEIKREIVAEREAARKEEKVAAKVEAKEKEAIAKADLEDRIKKEDKEKDSSRDATSNSTNNNYNFNSSDEDIDRFEHYSDGVLFNNFIEESRKDDETIKMVAMIGGFLVLIIFVVIFVTNNAIAGIF